MTLTDPTTDTSALATAPGPPPASGVSADDLAQIVEAYSGITEKMQASHERLQGEVIRLRQELASANAQLQRSRRLSALGEMAAGIAHEIRNPLAAIQLYAGMVVDDLAASEPRPAEALENTRKIASAVQGMSGIVNDVLSFAGGVEPTCRPCTASELFDRALSAHQPAIDAAGVHVVRRDLSRGAAAVYADAGLVQQALLNLVRNAVDAMSATAREGAARRLTLDVERDELGAVLVVADTGPGIPADRIERIFNPFFTTRSTGTGLGLAIVHRIIDAHGGSVAVTNDAGESEGNAGGGAVFRLSLPDPAGQPAHDETHAAHDAAVTGAAA